MPLLPNHFKMWNKSSLNSSVLVFSVNESQGKNMTTISIHYGPASIDELHFVLSNLQSRASASLVVSAPPTCPPPLATIPLNALLVMILVGMQEKLH